MATTTISQLPSGGSLQPGDIVIAVRVNPLNNVVTDYQATVPSSLGSSSSVIPSRLVTSGSTDSVLPTDSFIGWKSSATSAKVEAIGVGATNQTVYIKDAIGNAGTYSITVSASGCTIDNQSSFLLNQNYAAVGLKWDGISNWMVF